MVFKKVRPGLYQRTGTPKQVKITPKFAEAIRRDGNSTFLATLVDQAARDGDRSVRRTEQ